MIFCEQTVKQLGIGDFAAVVALYSGVNNQTTRMKPTTAIEGTSRVSNKMRHLIGNAKFPYGILLPTWIGGYTPWTVKRRNVRKISTFVGRTIPLIGEVILFADVSAITYRSIRDYNSIVNSEDKIW